MLASDKLYLSRLDAFNDPFEIMTVNPTLETKLCFDPDFRFAITEDPTRDDVHFAALRVCSLSEDCQDLLMWGHYADRHRGFCLRFEFGHDPELLKLLYPIEYTATASVLENDGATSFDQARKQTLKKSEKWSYEREWRLVAELSDSDSRASEFFATYKQQVLTAIIFGVRTPELHKSLVQSILAGHTVEFLQATKRRSEYSLDIQPYEDISSSHGD
jgi:hypothetical protein